VPEVITVGAVGESDRRASFSNRGRCVDLFAPGVQVRSASWLDDTASELRDGTSQAAPHVAGAAALCLGSGGVAGPCAGLAPPGVLAKLRADAAAYDSLATGFFGDPLRPYGTRYYGALAYAGGY
jgi:subtilisin family serine protease